MLILANEVVRIAQEKLWHSGAKINEILERKDLEEVASARLDYRETLCEKIQIGYLDLLVDQKMLGDR